MRASRTIFGFGLAGLLAVSGCGRPTGDATVSGSIILPRAAAEKSWGVALSSDGSEEEIVARASGTTDSALSIPYKLTDVPEGKYFLVAWVDQGDAADDADTHQVGDPFGVWSGGGGVDGLPNFKVAPGTDARGDVFLQKQAPDSYPDVSGTLTLPQAAPDQPYYVFIDTSSDSGDGYVDVDTGLTGDSNTIDYRISNIEPGTCLRTRCSNSRIQTANRVGMLCS
jgi:hypothetical protein